MAVLASGLSLDPLTLLRESPLVPIVDTGTWQRSARFGPDTVPEIATHLPDRHMIAERSACLASLVDDP